MGEFGSIAQFHEFVLEGNDKALERFYKSGRQSPVLGSEEFRQRVDWKNRYVLIRSIPTTSGLRCGLRSIRC